MSVSVIDGKVLEAPVKFSRKGLVRYQHLVFERPGGGIERIGKPVTTDEVAELIAPGAEGRFYMYKVLDVKGVHGVRLTGGAERYGYPGSNAGIFLGVAAISVAWLTSGARVVVVPLLGVLLLALGVAGFFLTRSNRAETKRQFDGDVPRTTRPAATGAPAATTE